jgi:hypothetical protein
MCYVSQLKRVTLYGTIAFLQENALNIEVCICGIYGWDCDVSSFEFFWVVTPTSQPGGTGIVSSPP